MDTKNRLVVARGRWWGVNKMGESGLKAQNSSYGISPGNVMYSLVTIVNNTLLYIWKLLKESILNLSQEKNVTICGDKSNYRFIVVTFL